jgi:hypothetical protein
VKVLGVENEAEPTNNFSSFVSKSSVIVAPEVFGIGRSLRGQ